MRTGLLALAAVTSLMSASPVAPQSGWRESRFTK
jgi:hypothetical protein